MRSMCAARRKAALSKPMANTQDVRPRDLGVGQANDMPGVERVLPLGIGVKGRGLWKKGGCCVRMRSGCGRVHNGGY